VLKSIRIVSQCWYRGNPLPGTKFITACVDIRNVLVLVKAEFLAVELQIKSANLSKFPVSDFSGSTTKFSTVRLYSLLMSLLY
jgi:hypothetical protein